MPIPHIRIINGTTVTIGIVLAAAIAVFVLLNGDGGYQASPTPSASVSATPAQSTPTPQRTVGASPTPTRASVQEYSKASYDAAVASGKPVVLYYYANWCPICAVEYPKFVAAVATFSVEDATFFRVNYNDSETTDEEELSAREHQVGYQHTMVIVIGGEQTYKSMATGNYESRIREQIQ